MPCREEKRRSYFSTFVYQSSPNYVNVCGSSLLVCNTVFRLMIYCFVPEIFAIKLRSCPKSSLNFDVLGPPFFGGRGPRIFDPILYTVTIEQVWWRSRSVKEICEIKQRKKIKKITRKNTRSTSEILMFWGRYSWRRWPDDLYFFCIRIKTYCSLCIVTVLAIHHHQSYRRHIVVAKS